MQRLGAYGFLYSVLQNADFVQFVLKLSKNKEHVHTYVLSFIMHILKYITK